MISVKSKIDAQIAYAILRDKNILENGDQEKLKELKRELRKFLNKPVHEERRCIYEDGYGYYIMLVRLPEFVKNSEDAEEYFDEFERMEYRPSPYDCTGQHFTTGHKIFKRHGRYWCYHHIAIDC